MNWCHLWLSNLNEGVLYFISLVLFESFTEIEVSSLSALVSDAHDVVSSATIARAVMNNLRLFLSHLVEMLQVELLALFLADSLNLSFKHFLNVMVQPFLEFARS